MLSLQRRKTPPQRQRRQPTTLRKNTTRPELIQRSRQPKGDPRTSGLNWKATSYYHEVRDILKVKQLLGHKTLRSTMIYIDIEKDIYGELSQEFTVKVAEDPQKIEKLLEVGFEYVCEKDGKLFFRKRK